MKLTIVVILLTLITITVIAATIVKISIQDTNLPVIYEEVKLSNLSGAFVNKDALKALMTETPLYLYLVSHYVKIESIADYSFIPMQTKQRKDLITLLNKVETKKLISISNEGKHDPTIDTMLLTSSSLIVLYKHMAIFIGILKPDGIIYGIDDITKLVGGH